MTKDELIMAIMRNVPYPNQITELNTSYENEVRFTWRDNKFCVNIHRGVGEVGEVGDGVLFGSDISILMREVIFKN